MSSDTGLIICWRAGTSRGTIDSGWIGSESLIYNRSPSLRRAPSPPDVEAIGCDVSSTSGATTSGGWSEIIPLITQWYRTVQWSWAGGGMGVKWGWGARGLPGQQLGTPSINPPGKSCKEVVHANLFELNIKMDAIRWKDTSNSAGLGKLWRTH